MKKQGKSARKPQLTLAVCLALMSVPIVAAGSGQDNLLSGNSSPYLRKASTQPVGWHPWGDAAWSEARKLDRPVLLDLGAAWCTYCTQMDRESYSNPETAAYINAHFVAVKVDYDAQPALSAKLERAAAYANLPAGLPLTGFLTPEGKFFADGSYLPAQAGHGKPSFREVMEAAVASYEKDRGAAGRGGLSVLSEP